MMLREDDTDDEGRCRPSSSVLMDNQSSCSMDGNGILIMVKQDETAGDESVAVGGPCITKRCR